MYSKLITDDQYFLHKAYCLY